MIFDELQQRYGAYVAELVRQALTLKEFEEYEVEELAPYFELRASRVRDEYLARLDNPETGNKNEDYLNVLRRRWQEAEELAYLVIAAEKKSSVA